MAFVKGDARINRNGRPLVVDAEKPTNRSLREKSFLQLVRKFYPLQSQAIQVAAKIMNDEKASENGRLKGAALIITTYKDLLKDVYDYRYDAEEAIPVQEDNKPIFSLKIVNADNPVD